jgi:hypothetical protein
VKRDRIVKDNIRLLKDGVRDALMDTCGELAMEHRRSSIAQE